MGVLSAVVAVDADCVAAAGVEVKGSAPTPMTVGPGWGKVKRPIRGAGTRFLRKRLWLTWWFGSNAFASEAMAKERTNVT